MIDAGQSSAEARALLDHAEALRARLHLSPADNQLCYWTLAIAHIAFYDRASLMAAHDLLVMVLPYLPAAGDVLAQVQRE